MGTLQQELMTKVQTLDSLRFDDDPNPPPTQETTVAIDTPKKSLRQVYWEWLRDNPASSARDLADAFGMAQTDAANILLKFLARNLVVRTKHGASPFCYTTAVDEYPVVSPEEKIRLMVEAKRRKPSKPYKSKRAKHAQDVKSLEQRKAELVKPGVANGFVDSVHTFINQLTVHQAKAVYDELKKIFGG